VFVATAGFEDPFPRGADRPSGLGDAVTVLVGSTGVFALGVLAVATSPIWLPLMGLAALSGHRIRMGF
jgi:hypothetical protein